MIEYIVVVIIGVIFATGINIVRPTEKAVVETLGKYSRTAPQGFHWIFPVIQNLVKVNITERRVDVDPQSIITKDKLNAEVDAVVFYKVKEVTKALYAVNDFRRSVPSLARTTLRAVVGKMNLSAANKNRQEINQNVERELDKQTEAWGIDIIRVEIQKIEPPRDVQDAMNMVVKAENEKISAKDRALAKEIEADGFKKAQIKQAEGLKQGSILKAEGEARAFDLINKSFTGNAQLLKQLEVTENSLRHNTKIVLSEKGVSPQIIIGDAPLVANRGKNS